MLVLTRKVGEAIYVGENVVIRINRVERNRVRLEIHAPKEVRILREELVPGVVPVESVPVESISEGPTGGLSAASAEPEPAIEYTLDPAMLVKAGMPGQ